MIDPNTAAVLRAVDALRRDVRDDLKTISNKLDDVAELAARVDERTLHLRPAAIVEPEPETDAIPVLAGRQRVANTIRRHAPTAGVSAIVVALVELAPTIAKAIAGLVS